MSFQANLQDHLRFLSENFEKCQFSSFQYAPTASTNIEVPAVFCFDSSSTTVNSSKQSVGDVGFIDLLAFRSEQKEVSGRASHSGRHTNAVAAVIAPPARPAPVAAPSNVESMFQDSELMNIDLDALVASELAKQANSSGGATFGPVGSSNSTSGHATATVVTSSVFSTTRPAVAAANEAGSTPVVDPAAALEQEQDLQRLRTVQRDLDRSAHSQP